MSHLSQSTLANLAELFQDRTISPRTILLEEGKDTPAALYIVRKGKIQLQSSQEEHYNNIIDAGGYFGEDMLEMDVGVLKKSTACCCKYSATALGEEVVIGVLTLEACRSILDTTILGQGRVDEPMQSIHESEISIAELEKHAILGAGTFGQVWLVSSTSSSGAKRPYALKIQSKYELIANHQAKGVLQ